MGLQGLGEGRRGQGPQNTESCSSPRDYVSPGLGSGRLTGERKRKGKKKREREREKKRESTGKTSRGEWVSSQGFRSRELTTTPGTGGQALIAAVESESQRRSAVKRPT